MNVERIRVSQGEIIYQLKQEFLGLQTVYRGEL
jgi:hypothetical protein